MSMLLKQQGIEPFSKNEIRGRFISLAPFNIIPFSFTAPLEPHTQPLDPSAYGLSHPAKIHLTKNLNSSPILEQLRRIISFLNKLGSQEAIISNVLSIVKKCLALQSFQTISLAESTYFFFLLPNNSLKSSGVSSTSRSIFLKRPFPMVLP